MNKMFEMPMVALNEIVPFPNVNITFDVLSDKAIEAIESVINRDRLILLATPKAINFGEVNLDNLFEVGCVVKVKNILNIQKGIIRITIEGVRRARVNNLVQTKPYFIAEAEYLDDMFNGDVFKQEAMVKLLKETVERHATLSPKAHPEFVMEVLGRNNLGRLCDLVASNLNIKMHEKQQVLAKLDILERAITVLRFINKENEILKIQADINNKVKASIEKAQKEYYLREQLKVINEELGDKDSVNGEIKDYRTKMKNLVMPQYATDKINKELDRLARIPQGSAEGSVCRDYIDTVLSLPWGKYSKENTNIIKAEGVLNKEHYGLENVKDRVIEFLAVRNRVGNANGTILCLVGPPGVGKTSIAKSIAKALNREYVRMSLGGIRDEAEVRGHRRTYIGAIPGRIIAAMKQAKANNPLILLDEIDKLGSDYKGDPSAAFLEVLDSEQNFAFQDNYMEMPYDVSKVLFICTANSLETIPRPLLDRMEIVELSSYTEEEKLHIANDYLVKKQLDKVGLKRANLKIRKEAIRDIITYYTRESGVRELERKIGVLCRKVVKKLLAEDKNIIVTEKNLADYLGKKVYRPDAIEETSEVGLCRGLAWTSVGGTTLNIEVNILKGNGKHVITGNVGKVMEESYEAAISYIRANADKLGVDILFDKIDIHIHIPEAATPKDGPSAGITMVTAMVSAMTNIPVRNDIAMTGEVTLRGKVMPIGGLKEKVLAARRIGVRKIIIPSLNAIDLDEIPDYAKEDIEFVLADRVDQVLENALVGSVMPIVFDEVAVSKILINNNIGMTEGLEKR